MPSASEEIREIWPGCCTCIKRFKAHDEIYMEVVDGRVTTWCEDCFVKALMLRIDDIDGEAWMCPAMELYRHFFPGERTSKYVKPLMRAMTILMIKNLNENETKEKS